MRNKQKRKKEQILWFLKDIIKKKTQSLSALLRSRVEVVGLGTESESHLFWCSIIEGKKTNNNAKTTSEHLSVLSLSLSLSFSFSLWDSLHLFSPCFKLFTFNFSLFFVFFVFICRFYEPALLTGKEKKKKKGPTVDDKNEFHTSCSPGSHPGSVLACFGVQCIFTTWGQF